MKALALVLAALVAAPVPAPARQAPAPGAPKTMELRNGSWYDGEGFRRANWYSVGGRLTARRPKHVDSVVDLSGKYVVPPFGEGHNHNIETSRRVDATIARYLAEGTFYVKNPNNLPDTAVRLAGKINVPTSVDVVFANGGLTCTGGHPSGMAERNVARGVWTAADGEGGFFHSIDTVADLDAKWQKIVAGRPDFIKTYLLYSEEHAKRKADPAYTDWRGLDPALLPEIVRRAHAATLRVTTHVETAADFHAALAAGVDEINHLPGFRPEGNDPANYRDLDRYRISPADARLAARRGVVVVTTVVEVLAILDEADAKGPKLAAAGAVREMLLGNLRTLARAGVTIAIGSDDYRGTALGEAMALRKLGAFDAKTLVKMWCETTPRAIFPGRKIGMFREGYEASFLVLRGDPIADFDNVTRIETRVKQGHILPAPASQLLEGLSP